MFLKPRQLISLLASFALCICLPVIAQNADIDEQFDSSSRFAEGEELIMSIKVDNLILGEAFTYKTKNGLQIGLNEFLSILDFPITRYADFKYQGWYISEDNEFSLTQSEAGLNISAGDSNFVVDKAEYQIYADDLYIELEALNQWFQLNIEIDYDNLNIFLSPTTPLPIQLALARKNREILDAPSNNNQAVRPYLNRGYQIFSAQVLDIQAALTANETDVNGFYSVLGAREIAYHKVNFFATGNDDIPVSLARFNVQKQSANKDLLGFLGASHYEFGDVTPVRVGNLDDRRQTMGLYVTNTALNAPLNTEVTSFAGEILPGWDVELYRNGILIDQLSSVESGRYEFNNVDLFLGDNEFELVFYGPQGQVRRERISQLLSAESLNTDKLTYAFSINKDDSVLIKDEAFPEDIAETYSVSANYSYNLFDSTRLHVAHVNKFGDNSDSTYDMGVSSVLFDKLLLNVNFTNNTNGESNLAAQLRTNLLGQSVSLQLSQTERLQENSLSDFDSVDFAIAGNLWKGDSFRLNHLTRIIRTNSNNLSSYSIRNNLGLSVSRFNIFNQLEYFKQGDDESAFGTFGLQGGFWGMFTRAFVNYSDVTEQQAWEILSYGGELSYAFNESLNARLSAIENLNDESSRYRLDIDWRDDWWSVSANMAYSPLLGKSFGVLGRLNFGGTPEYGEYIGNNRSLTAAGTALIRAFIDENGNYIYDPHEKLVQGLKFTSQQSRSVGYTNSSGVAELHGLSANKQTDIEIDRSSLKDPFLVPALVGFSITPRAAFVDKIDFPLVNAGEIDGVFYISNFEGESSIGPYISLNLYDHKHRIVSSTKTEFDGFFLFTAVKPGRYYLKPSDHEMQKNGFVGFKAKWLTIDRSGNILANQDMTIEQLEQRQYFIAKAGNFSSKEILSAYWTLNRNSFKALNKNIAKVGFVQNDDSSFSLILVSSLQRTRALEACSTAQQLKLACTVRDTMEWIDPWKKRTTSLANSGIVN